MNHQDDREGADRELAREAEEYRDSVSKGGHGARKPCEQYPIEEAREQGIVPDEPPPSGHAS